MRSSKKIFRVACVVLIVGLAGGPAAFGQNTAASYEGAYLKIIGSHHAFAGHFDGEHYFETSDLYADYLYFVPKLASAAAVGLGFGVRQEDTPEMFLSYTRSSHGYTFLDVSGKARYSVLGMDVKYRLLDKGFVQPYAVGDFGLTWLMVEKGSMRTDPPGQMADNRFVGFTIGGGGGLEICPSPAFGIFGEAILNWKSFGHMRGIEDIKHETDMVNSVTIDFRFGIRFRIGRL